MSEPQNIQTGRARHRSVELSDPLQTLVNSLTLDQLRFAVSKLSPTKRIPLRSHQGALDSLLRTGKSTQEILTVLLGIESDTPAKHCLLVSCTSGMEGLINSPQSRVTGGGFAFEIVHRAQTKATASVTFVHNITVQVWENESDDVRRRKLLSIRHPIVFRYYKSIGAGIFMFPGYSQGDAISRANRINYDQVLLSLISKLKSDFGLGLGVLPIERAIRMLAEGDNDRVKIVGSDVEAVLGRIGIAANVSSVEQNSVDDVIANFVGPHLSGVDRSALKAAVATAFRDAPANSLVVSWLKERYVTRISFWEFGADLFFIWRGSGQSLYSVDGVMSLLVDIATQVAQEDGQSAWDELSGLQPGTLVLLSNFVGRHSLDSSKASALLVKALKAGLLRPLYRLRTHEELEDHLNNWQPSLLDLARQFVTVSGTVIDGQNAENIEVAFARTGGAA